MSVKSIDIAKLLNKCFYLAFIEGKDYEYIESFINKDETELQFDFLGFIDSVKQSKNTLGLVPIEVCFDSECSSSTIKEIELEFENHRNTGGYTRIFLDYLFDDRFKLGLNSVLKNKYPDSEPYFRTRTNNGLFDMDLISEYLDLIKSSYSFEAEKYDVSEFTKRVAVRGTKSEKVKELGTEKFDNIYSIFKIFGQGEYSKILISVLHNKSLNIEIDKPYISRTKYESAIFHDKEISKAVPKNYIEGINLLSVVDSRILERESDTIENELQRFFDDYIPSDLDRQFVFEGKNKGNTLREDLTSTFRWIISQENALYRSIRAETKEDKDELYKKFSNNRDFFSKSEVSFITDNFRDMSNDLNTTEHYTIKQRIDFLMTLNLPELNKSKRWQKICEKYKEYYPKSLEDKTSIIDKNEGNERYNADYMQKVSFINEQKMFVIQSFRNAFCGEKQFLEALENDIKLFEDFDSKKFILTLKGDVKHPWGRFWTIYNRNSEIKIFKTQKQFTQAMNAIEDFVVTNGEKR